MEWKKRKRRGTTHGPKIGDLSIKIAGPLEWEYTDRVKRVVENCSYPRGGEAT